jgi:hypothetical protein
MTRGLSTGPKRSKRPGPRRAASGDGGPRGLTKSACAWDKQGQRREGPTSARTTIRVHRTPPFVRGAWHACTHDTNRESPSMAAGQESARACEEVTSLVRALALHGVAMLRSHLASPLKPGRGVLIRSVSRRLGSVACVREDASPNEVSVLTNPRMPASLPECQTEPPSSRSRRVRFTVRSGCLPSRGTKPAYD